MQGTRLLLIMVLGIGVIASPLAAEVAVPEALRGWEAWVLDGAEYRRCPVISGRQASGAEDFICAWPGRLELAIDDSGGTFRQPWRLVVPGWVSLPGDARLWPAEVTVDGAAAPVVSRDGRPMLRLAAGTHTVSGAWRWPARPQELPIPAEAALIALELEGAPVAHPVLDGNRLLLGAETGTAEPPTLELTVYRLLRDTVPAELDTHIRLRVGGNAREQRLRALLPEGFTAIGIESPLTTRLEPDGSLRVQLRAGTWEIVHRARGTGVAAELVIDPVDETVDNRAAWVDEEIWSFAAEERLRVASVDGVDSINPAQAQVPGDWQEYPAYRVTPGTPLRVVERSRGLPDDNDNALSLNREVWLDFDHGGYTIVDHVTGTMRDGWRLEMAPPYRLQSARTGEDALLITRTDDDRTGIELRDINVDLHATARLESASGAHAASGWNERFRDLRGTLNLPPGHRLLAAPGAEAAPNAWLNRWDLLDIFLVLVTSVAVFRLLGRSLGILAGAALVLTFHEPLALNWLWINAVIALALTRFVTTGWLYRLTRAYRVLALVGLIGWLVPFSVNQLRLALYPQLESPARSREDFMASSPVAAPAQELMLTGEQMSRARAYDSVAKLEEVIVAGSSVPRRYAPGTLVQAGPGVPNWRFQRYDYRWNGPVAPDNEVRFVIAGRWLVSLWRVCGVALAVLLLLRLMQRVIRWPFGPGPVTAVAVLAIANALWSPPASAQIPDSALLEELRVRLTRPPECAPNCAEIQRAEITTSAENLSVVLTVNALIGVAVAVPTAPGRWRIDAVRLDDTAPAALHRAADGRQLVDVSAGVHRIGMQGALLAADSVQLVFPQVPHAISFAGSGWETSGIDAGRLLTNTLELIRQRGVGDDERIEVSAQVPPFVRITRVIQLGLDWSIHTSVERVAPVRGAFTIAVPLLPGEAVLDPDLSVRDGVLIAAFSAEQQALGWDSALPLAAELRLTQAEDAAWTEVWTFAVHDVWRARFSGLAPVEPVDAGRSWRHEYHPRAGETLQVGISRPEAIPGTTLAIDTVNLRAELGRRAGNHALSFSYRATQGGRHTLTLPGDARVTGVTVDGEDMALRPEQGQLPLTILPGAHEVAVRWEEDSGVATRARTPAVDLGASAANARLEIALPDDRWLLYAGRGGVAPVVLYWGELVVFILVALAIGRSTITPLRTHEWLLLGLGLSTFAWFTLLVFVAWVFALRWRERWSGTDLRWQRNLVQGSLVLLTVFAIGGLIAAIPNGLLAQPDMSVRGADSWQQSLSWFFDEVGGVLPRVSALSISLWWYKAAMLAWALWLALALMRWLPWAWRAFHAQPSAAPGAERG